MEIKNNILMKSNSMVWILAVSPLLGITVQALIADIFIFRFNSLWVITISINLLAAIMDMEILKHESLYNPRIGNPMLIPVYLYKRAKTLDQPLYYLLVWCFSIIAILFTPSWKIASFYNLNYI
jgi:hypothetical protein